MEQWIEQVREAAGLLSGCKRAVASTGAGVSAESGIDTFRDVGGIWDRLDPAEVGTVEGLISTLKRDAQKILPLLFNLLDSFSQAEPNSGHKALADLEDMGILRVIITQNGDNLHQEAGSTKVVEVHGNAFRMRCLSCGARKNFERKPLAREVMDKLAGLPSFSLMHLASLAPQCPACGFSMRPDVVMFGEMVMDMDKAFFEAGACDALLALGTSGTVYPAASLPMEAKRAGAPVIVVNPTENSFSQVSDIYIPARTEQALPAIVSAIREISAE